MQSIRQQKSKNFRKKIPKKIFFLDFFFQSPVFEPFFHETESRNSGNHEL